MMRRPVFVIFAILICLFSVSASAETCAFVREHDGAGDVIRFLDIEYLTPFDDVERIIKKEYGENSFDYWLPMWGYTAYSDSARGNRVNIMGKRRRMPFFWESEEVVPLNWEIWCEKAEHLLVDYIQYPYSPDQDEEDPGKMYLCGGVIVFAEPGAEKAERLMKRLDERFGKGVRVESELIDLDVVYTDENGNTAELVYNTWAWYGVPPDEYDLYITFECGDVYRFFEEQSKEKQ